MKLLKNFITGTLALTAFVALSPGVSADVCDQGNIDTHYKGIYCGIRTHSNEDADDDVIEVVAKQFQFGGTEGAAADDTFQEEVVVEILNETLCNTINELRAQDNQDELQKYIIELREACSEAGRTATELLAAQEIFEDVKNAYRKEKAMQQNSKALKFKFKASEQYWDGQLGAGAPFDLIVDLNLIEIVLFGSQAQWMGDVFMFPHDEEGGEGEGEAPLDELLPSAEVDLSGERIGDEGDTGLVVEGEGEGEGEGPDCVPPDDPNADLGNQPGGDSLFCGNGVIDPLAGETCDDGNKESGDGCNQFCREEDSGANLMCSDPEAVTFRGPGDGNGGAGGEGGEGEGGSECPPGTVPRFPTIGGEGAGLAEPVPQLEGYPGPFLGGTLKQFPESARPECPPGSVAAREETGSLEVSATGNATLGINIGGEQFDIPRCLPTEFCADFDAARDFLFGEDWEDDDVLVNVAPSIEALFCVNIVQANRPQSPYNLIEGCIDCHITAMVDAIEEALQTNVTPVVNTTSAFSISSLGPNFSFNLQTAVKSKPKFYEPRDTAVSAQQESNRYFEESRKKNEVSDPTIPTLETAEEELLRHNAKIENAQSKLLEDARTFRLSTAPVSEIEVSRRIAPLLNQMSASFARINSKYAEIVAATEFDELNQCQ